LRTVDANVILRYLLNDVPSQAQAARTLIESDRPLAICPVALAETAWTLVGSRYRHNRALVAGLLVELLARENVVTIGVDKAQAQAALAACGAPTGGPSFGDALIAAAARSAGLTEIYSFDRRFARAGLTPVPPA
jgi:predicted nucleic acid-binding protein